MAFVNKYKVISKAEQAEIILWKIKDPDGSVIDSQTEEDMTVEESVRLLTDALDDIEGKWVKVELRKKGGKKIAEGGNNMAGNFDYKVKLDDSIGSVSDKRHGASSGREMDLLREIGDLKAEIVELKMDAKRKQDIGVLKEEIKEMKSGNALDQLLPHLIPLFQRANAGVSAAPAAINGPKDATPKDQIIAAVNRLRAKDPEFHIHITKLADMAENNPDMYKTALSFLK